MLATISISSKSLWSTKVKKSQNLSRKASHVKSDEEPSIIIINACMIYSK